MKIDTYLDFLYTYIKSNCLFETDNIDYFYLGNELSKNLIVNKKIKLNFSIVKVKLGYKKYLLINDIPLNILVSQSIFIGNKTQLYEFTLQSDKSEVKTKYITSNQIIKYINYKIDEDSIKKVEVESLNKLEFEFEFEQPIIIKKLKKYILENKNLNLNSLHIIDSDKIELFLPNIKKSDYKLSKKLQLPIVSIFKNSLIKDTNIDVFDYNVHNKIIEPFSVYNEFIKWPFQKNTNTMLYKDINEELIIKLHTNRIIRFIESSNCLNVDKEKLILEVKKINKIKISTKKPKNDINEDDNLFIPLFKSVSNQEYIKFNTGEEFFKITGIHFKLDRKYLKDIFIQTIRGEKTILKDYYLDNKIKKIIQNINYDYKENIINYKSIYELIIKIDLVINKLSYIPHNFKIKLEKDESIENINKYKNILKKVLKKVILKTIEYNQLPKEEYSDDIMIQYYISLFNSIYYNYSLFVENKLNLNELILLILKYLDSFKSSVYNIEIEFNQLYYINNIILLLISILKLYDKNGANNIKSLFSEYFENDNLEILDYKKYKKGKNILNYEKSKINKRIEENISIIAIGNKLSKNKQLYCIVFPNNEIYLKYKKFVSNNLKILNINNLIIKNINYSINYNKLKTLFPYSYKQIAEEIILNNFDKNNIKINNKEIKIQNDYLNVHYNYDKLKEIKSSNNIKIYKKII